jgi:hypothetical protein
MPRLLRIAVSCLAAACLAVGSGWWAHASERSPEVRALSKRIREAESHIERWNRRLARWQTQVGRVSVSVERLTARASALPGSVTTPDLLSRHTPRASLLSYRVEQAHTALQRILRDPAASNAQHQLVAWGAYLGQLEAARRQAMAEPAPSGAGGSIAPGSPVTYEAWARGFLGRLGAPDCAENLTLVVTWETAESTSALFNPLATTHAMEGAGDLNSVGVKNYASLEQGLDASRDTIEGGAAGYGYGAILDAVRACAPAETTAAAINASAWCRGCAGGTYLTGLLPVVRSDYAGHASRLIASLPA